MGIVTLKRVVLGVCGDGKIIQVRVPPILTEPCIAYPQSFIYYIIIYIILKLQVCILQECTYYHTTSCL